MKHTYKISGMTCDGCRNHVEQTLSQVEGIEKAAVDLKSGEAVLTMSSHVPLEKLQQAMVDDGGAYSISAPGDPHHHKDAPLPKKKSKGKGTGTYYCPMHCEGDKTYDQPGNCPVCGMDLVEEITMKRKDDTQYTCTQRS